MSSSWRYIFLALFSAVSFAWASAPSLELRRKIAEAAGSAALDPLLVEAVMEVESKFKHAISPKGAIGLMQVMPRTADANGIHNPHHAFDNLMGACEYLRKLINRYQGDLRLALAAYNAGPHNVDRYRAIPPFRETRQYVKKVLQRYEALKKSQ